MERKDNNQPDQANNQPPESPVERRYFQSEARAAKADDGAMRVGGYGAIFNKYTNMGWYAEIVMPGFFDGIKDDRCACLFNHDQNIVLGRKKNETLTLKTDGNGLDYESLLPAHRADVYELVQRGDVYESSFAFTTLKSVWEDVDRSLLAGLLPESDLDALTYGGKITVRRLEKGKELFDVSPVTYAAYEGTTTDTREARSSYNAWKAIIEKEQPPETPPQIEPATNRRALLADAIARAAR